MEIFIVDNEKFDIKTLLLDMIITFIIGAIIAILTKSIIIAIIGGIMGKLLIAYIGHIIFQKTVNKYVYSTRKHKCLIPPRRALDVAKCSDCPMREGCIDKKTE
jgi:hypothetical protein